MNELYSACGYIHAGLTVEPLMMYSDGTRLVTVSWDGEYIKHAATGNKLGSCNRVASYLMEGIT